MGTTDVGLARMVLRELRRTRFPGALLHGEASIASSDFAGDIDLACSADLGFATRALFAATQRVGLTPLLVWPYDVNSVAIIAIDESKLPVVSGVHFDILADRQGLGKYGIRTPPLVSASRSGHLVPSVSSLDRALYLWRKGVVKQQPSRTAGAIAALNAFSQDEVAARIAHVFRGGPIPLPVISTRQHADYYFRRSLLCGGRFMWRARFPIGIHIAVSDLRDAVRIRHMFRNLLPVVKVYSGPLHALYGWIGARRPGITIVVRPDSPTASRPPDYVIDKMLRRLFARARQRSIEMDSRWVGGHK